MTSSWTPEREALMRRMWGEGRSAAEIARALGGVNRNAVFGKIHRLGLGRYTVADAAATPKPKEKEKAKAKLVCAVPGCGDPLSSKNAMGVCLVHKHAAGLCRCPKCQGHDGPRRAEPISREGVRSATVPRTGTSTSGGEATVRVSLKREPWLSA